MRARVKTSRRAGGHGLTRHRRVVCQDDTGADILFMVERIAFAMHEMFETFQDDPDVRLVVDIYPTIHPDPLNADDGGRPSATD